MKSQRDRDVFTDILHLPRAGTPPAFFFCATIHSMGEGKKRETFGSFGELKKHYEEQETQRNAQQQERENKQREGVAEIYREVLAGKFDKVPKGTIQSRKEGINWFRFDQVATEPGKSGQLIVNVNYGDDKHTWGTIYESDGTGIVAGKLSKDLPLSQLELSREVLETIESIDLDFWHQVDFPMLSERGRPIHEARGEGTTGRRGRGSEVPVVDPERLQFLSRQPRVLLGFVTKEKGFEGYRGAMFVGSKTHYAYLVLENPEVNNAAYIVKLTKEVPAEEKLFSLEPKRRASARERERYEHELWEPVMTKARTKAGLLTLPQLDPEVQVQRVVHTPETWQEKMQEAIDRME